MCYPHERVWVERLLQEHSQGATFSEPKLMSHIIETPEVKLQVGERYFRGIAKIGLHYFLSQFPVYSGHEQIFSRIRSFIFEETTEPIRRVDEFIQVRCHPLVLPMLDPNARPVTGWRAHVLAAETCFGKCTAHIQMFFTEHNPGRIYTVNLAKDPTIAEDNASAHLYRYFSGGP